jgi:hypothetical protein
VAAQQPLRVIDPFTHVWRYDDSGRDLGTAWRETGYDDLSWRTGMGLFGLEPGVPFPYAPAGYPAIDVPLALTPPGSGSQTITFYFRTHFQVPSNSLPGLVLVATNYLDEGAVIYLNGAEAGRVRVPFGQSFLTLASSSQAVEGQADVTNLLTAPLRAGDNVLAVEVHQASSFSSDIAFAMSLTALLPEPLAVTRSPLSRTNVVGASATFDVEVSGGPVTYQWFKNGVPIAGARTNSYTLPQLQMSHAGSYTVQVSNAVSTAVSDAAVLTIVPDTFGPKLVSAIVQEGGASNRVIVTFSERLLVSTATNVANYRITPYPAGAPIIISNIAYVAGPLPRAQLRLDDPHWRIGENYVLTVNGLRDLTASNSIAPDSQIGIGWPQALRVLPPDQMWDYHTAAVFDSGVFTTPWWEKDYTPGLWWAQGTGVFCGGPVVTTPCFGSFQTEIGFQSEPSLFRTTFQWPAQLGSSGNLRIGYTADDGLILYLNGVELFRTNLPSGPIYAGTLAPVSLTAPICVTGLVVAVNLQPGSNTLAAAVCQPGTDGNSVFGLQMDALFERTSPVPSSPTPALRITLLAGDSIQLSWDGSGYALEGSPTLSDSNSAPIGPWTEEPDVSNPFTVSPAAPQRFYRLRK